MDLIQDIHPIIEHELTTDELIAMINFGIMILRERTDDSINYNISTKQISSLARVIDNEPSDFRKNYEKKEQYNNDLPF